MFDTAPTGFGGSAQTAGLEATITVGYRSMLETLAIILLLLWALGLFTSYTAGGLIHILLVVAIVVILLRVIQGRRL